MARDEYSIIKIINDKSVVVNYGSNQNAQVGDILEIFEKGEEILDPISNESLGTLDIIKGRLEVRVVYEKMSYCRNAYTETFSPMVSIDLTKTYTKRLDVDSSEISGGYGLTDKKIRVGDLVRKPLGSSS